MRTFGIAIALLSFGNLLGAQSVGKITTFAVGVDYIRAYSGSGLALQAALDRRLSEHIQIGIPLTLAWTGVRTSPDPRSLAMLGTRLRFGSDLRPHVPGRYIGISFLLITSSIADVPRTQGGGSFPVNERVGSHWGLGGGLDGDVVVPIGRRAALGIGGGMVLQKVYSDDPSVAWMAGLTLLFR